MPPRRSPPRSCRETNAPRRCLAEGMSGMRGPGWEPPASVASIAQRANASSARRSSAVRGAESSGPAMVFLSAADRVGPVELLVDHHPGELMRQSQRPKAPAPLRAFHHVRRQAVGAADRKRHVAALQLPATRQLGVLLRGPGLAVFRQCNETRILEGTLRDSRLAHFPFLDFGVMAKPAQVVVTRRAQRRALHSAAAERDHAIAHQAYMPRSRCMPATRSTATM